MLLTPSEADAEFFRLVHSLAKVHKDQRFNERRTQARHPFTVRQRIAPVWGNSLPDSKEFFDVLCYDVNRGGFSFLVPTPPPFRHFVVQLGETMQPIELLAEVVHTHPVAYCPQTGQVRHLNQKPVDFKASSCLSCDDPKAFHQMTLVGCRFVGRIKRDPPTANQGTGQ